MRSKTPVLAPEFVRRLNLLMDEAGLRYQKDLAVALGRAESTVTPWFRGYVRPSVATLQMLLGYFSTRLQRRIKLEELCPVHEIHDPGGRFTRAHGTATPQPADEARVDTTAELGNMRPLDSVTVHEGGFVGVLDNDEKTLVLQYRQARARSAEEADAILETVLAVAQGRLSLRGKSRAHSGGPA